MKCVVDRYKWHRPFQTATTVLNGNDRLRKGNLLRRHVLGSCSVEGQNHDICTHMKMLRVYVSGICCSDMSHEVQLVELNGTRRGDKITPKLVLHNYKSISSHEGTCRCNISLKQVPATFSCV